MKVKMLAAAAVVALVAACATDQTSDDMASGSSTSSGSTTSSSTYAPDTTGSSGAGSTDSSTYGGSMGSSTGSYSATGGGSTGAAAGSTTTAASADIVGVAQGAGQFTTLVSAIQTAGLVDTLKGPGPYTVFAPTDAAFKAMPSSLMTQLMQPENKGRLVSVLTYHVVPGRIASTDVSGTQTLKTVQGGTITVSSTGGTVKVNDANVVSADVPASNGIVHAIDKVLIPSAKAS